MQPRCLGATMIIFAGTMLAQVPTPPNIASPLSHAPQSPPELVPQQDGIGLDAGSTPVTATKPRSTAKRMLDKVTPHCVSGAVASCWSSPVVDPQPAASKEAQQFVKDMAVGNFYLEQRNYHAAQMRFRSALGYRPSDPEARFRVAQCAEKLGQRNDAVNGYEAYVAADPNGKFSGRAKQALQRLK